VIEGYEALGGIRFADVELAPGQETSYILLMGILQDGESAEAWLENYATNEKFERALEETQVFWASKVAALTFETGDPRLDGWLTWVALQPTLRRLMGNSFLPYHDYGRGGRGWRDLWQDVLALLMMARGDVSEMLLGYFGGVRADGSNATIIGSQPGEFRADRNGHPARLDGPRRLAAADDAPVYRPERRPGIFTARAGLFQRPPEPSL
jgi:cellobiose phosphorylase